MLILLPMPCEIFSAALTDNLAFTLSIVKDMLCHGSLIIGKIYFHEYSIIYLLYGRISHFPNFFATAPSRERELLNTYL